MQARYSSCCNVCLRNIEPGQDIVHETGIGWIHSLCRIGLDEPIALTDAERKTYGATVRTRREYAEYNTQWDAAEDAETYFDPLFGGYELYDYCD